MPLHTRALARDVGLLRGWWLRLTPAMDRYAPRRGVDVVEVLRKHGGGDGGGG